MSASQPPSDPSRDKRPLPRRESSFDAAREFRRQRTFSSELSARLGDPPSKDAPSDAAAKSKAPEDNNKAAGALEPVPSNDQPADPRRVSFQPAAPQKSHSDSTSSDDGPANLIPLDPEKGLSSPERTLPHYFPPGARWKTYFQQEIAANHFLEAQLLVLSLATGIVDAVTTSNYSVFVSKQTGNTIYLALWAVDHPSIAGLERNIGVSMGFFVLGSIFFGHVGHAVRQRRRSWLLLNNLLQCVLVYAAVALAYLEPPESTGAPTLAIIALLAFASGGQISLAVCVKLPELNTVMITGALIQLATDRRFFRPHNAPRNRRLLFFAAVLAGAFIGAAATTYVGARLALLLNAVVKTLVCLSFLLNHGMLVPPGQSTPKESQSGTATPFAQILWGD